MKDNGWKMGTRFLLLGLVFLFIPALASAQEFPTKPINVRSTFGPGTPFDIAFRLLASRAEKMLGQPFAVINDTTGGGMIAMNTIAKEKPDGHNLLLGTTTTFVWVPQFRKVNVKYQDYTPIVQFGKGLIGMVVRAEAPYKTLKELVEYTKKNPGKLSYGATAKSTPKQVALEVIAKQEGIDWTFVPFDADNLSLAALLGGHVDICSAGTAWIPFVQQGKVRLLATFMESRSKTFPDVPTAQELGYRFADPAVYLIAGPKGMPPSTVKKLEDAFHKAMEDQEFLQLMKKGEMEVFYRNSADLTKLVDQSFGTVRKMIVDFKLPIEE
jgi:tripartite-type tricarboxylate transporter receptor subunit TctC